MYCKCGSGKASVPPPNQGLDGGTKEAVKEALIRLYEEGVLYGQECGYTRRGCECECYGAFHPPCCLLTPHGVEGCELQDKACQMSWAQALLPYHEWVGTTVWESQARHERCASSGQGNTNVSLLHIEEGGPMLGWAHVVPGC
jgi:hypothetical protein